MRVHNHYETNKRTTVEEKSDTFLISDKMWEEGLDPKFQRIEARLFFPWYYWLHLPFWRRDLKHTPRIKLIINWKTNKAFWMEDWAQKVLKEGKIQWAAERKRFLYSNLNDWASGKGLTLVERGAEEADLLEE